MSSDPFGNPFTRIELCVFTLFDGTPSVLLVRRAQGAEQGKWVLPGGQLNTQRDTDLHGAAKRIAVDTIAPAWPYLKQQCALGRAKRDDGHDWTLSVVYRSVVRNGFYMPVANVNAEDQRWTSVWDLHKMKDIATVYEKVIDDAVADLLREVEALDVPFQLLPAEFTITELQVVCEQLTGTDLDRVSFRRRVLDGKIVQETGNIKTGTAHRPAQLYRAAR